MDIRETCRLVCALLASARRHRAAGLRATASGEVREAAGLIDECLAEINRRLRYIADRV